MKQRPFPEPENSRQIEILLTALYLLHTIFLCAAALVTRQNAILLLPAAAGGALSVYLCAARRRSYAFRAYFTGCLLWINLSLYALFTDDFAAALTMTGAAAVLLALYCLPHICRIGAVFFTAIVVIRLFILRDPAPLKGGDSVRTLIGVLSVYFIQFLVWYFVRMQQESNLHLLANIESLRKAEQSKDDFMANVSHEIRTPVNTICGMSEIMLQDKLPPETRDYAYSIQIAGRNLLSLVNDILDFSELESGKISILDDAYSITSVVNDIITTANAKNSEKQLSLIVDCDPSMPETLIGDRQKICRAVINVLDNAIKFTQEGGIFLSIGTRREAYGVNLCFTIRDTGVGIAPEMLERIFTSFNQADTRRSRTESGIGLGLAISKAIVDRMGGFLKIDSVYGEGTSASIVIPQKVEDPTPCIFVKHPQDVRIALYLHPDKYKFPLLREGSKRAVANMVRRFDVEAHSCRNLSEVKRRIRNESVTHLFIGQEEYREAPDYFEEIAGRLVVTLIVERNLRQETAPDRILCVGAPLYALSVASVLNGESVRELAAGGAQNHFTAPDAHVLVVDDNLMNLKVVEGLLRPYRLKLSVAGSGREALEKLESKAYDFIFMDHMMPEMDGVETFRRIREKHDDYYKNVPVIALTANAVGNAREMFLAEGFADYISKPIELSALEHVLRKVIPKEKIVYAGSKIRIVQPQNDSAREDPAGADSGVPASVGVDTASGIAYCGGRLADYLDIVRIYCSGGEKNIRGVQKAFADGDWKTFVILTHTIKSTSKSIGAGALSDLAKELEASGKRLLETNRAAAETANAADTANTADASDAADAAQSLAPGGTDSRKTEPELSALKIRTEEMLSAYAALLQTLRNDKTIFPETPEGHPGADVGETAALTAEEFCVCRKELAQLLDAFDEEAVISYLERVSGRIWNGRPLSDLFAPVRSRVEDFDFLGAADALAGIAPQNGNDHF